MALKKSNRWLDNINPLRGLGRPRLVSLLAAGERGQYADLQWFYHHMERSDAMIHAVIQRRRSALLTADWDIRLVPEVSGAGSQDSGARSQKTDADGLTQPPSSDYGEPRRRKVAKGDGALADEQADCLRKAYDGVENFRDAVAFLFTAIFRGYAHLEKHYEAGRVNWLGPVEQWFWVRDGMFGEWEYNADAQSGRLRGLGIEREGFVICEAECALDRILAPLFLRRQLNELNWDGLLDGFGIPSVFIVGPPNTPEAKEAEYQRIAEEIISNGRGYLPNGSDLKYVDAGGSGRVPFRERLEWIDRQIALVGTGGLLTMLAEPGSGTLAGNAHSETFRQIAISDAAALSEVFQRDFDAALLAAAFPGQPVRAYLEFVLPDTGDTAGNTVDAVRQLSQAGYFVDPETVSEKTGLPVTTAPVSEAGKAP